MRLTGARKALYTVLAGLALANVVLLPSLRGILISELSYAAAAIVLVFVLSLASDNLVHHVVCLHPSTPSQLFLSWWLLSDVATIRTRWLLGENNRVLASVGIVSAAAKLAVLVVEEWSKRRMLLPEQSKSPPEGLAGVLNRMLLIWWENTPHDPYSLPQHLLTRLAFQDQSPHVQRPLRDPYP